MKRYLLMICMPLVLVLLMPVLAFAEETAAQPEPPVSVDESVDESESSSADGDTAPSAPETPAEDDSSKDETENADPSDGTETTPESGELTGEAEENKDPDVTEDGETTPDVSEQPDEEGTGSSDESEGETGENGGNEDSAEDNEEDVDDKEDEGDKADDETETDDKSSGNTSKKPSQRPSYASDRLKATYDGTEVTIEVLGTLHTQIRGKSGKLEDVLTAELVFSETETEEQALAYIIAPKTGRAALRDRAAKDETIIRYCAAGDLLVVLEAGENYTRVNYKGTKGYVQNNCLQLLPITEENGEYAELSYKGSTSGSTTINIRNQPDRSSCKIAEWRTGKEVTVWDYADGWYEIEADGMRGFVMEEFVTIAPGA